MLWQTQTKLLNANQAWYWQQDLWVHLWHYNSQPCVRSASNLKSFWQITLLHPWKYIKTIFWDAHPTLLRGASRRPELRLDNADRITLFRTPSPLSVCPASVWFQFSSYGISRGEVFFQYFLPKESSFTKGFNVEKIPLSTHDCTTCKVLHLWQKGPELKYIFIPLIIKQNVHFSSLRLKYIVGVLTMHCLNMFEAARQWY